MSLALATYEPVSSLWDLAPMARAYAEAVIRLSPYPPFRTCSLADFSMSALSRIVEDCREFQRLNALDLEGGIHPAYWMQWRRDGQERAGFDFFCTRNCIDPGFCSAVWPAHVAYNLFRSARRFGGTRFYMGDDLLIYQQGAEDA